MYFTSGMIVGIFLGFLILFVYGVTDDLSIRKRIVEQEMAHYCSKTGKMIIDDKINYILYGKK